MNTVPTPIVYSRNWFIVILYTSIILATVPFARTVWNFLGDRLGSILLLFLYFCIVLYVHFQYRKLIILGFILLISFAIFEIISLPIERIHFIEYGILGWLLRGAVGGKRLGLAIAVCYIAGVGILDEIIQGVLPDRYFDIRDIMMNAAGGLIGLVFGGARAYAK